MSNWQNYKPYWQRVGARRPFPPLYKAIEMYGEENVMFPPPDYVPEKHCRWCGKAIVDKRKKHYCSVECSKAYNDATVWNRGRDPYSLRILYRDKFTCQDCGEIHAFRNNFGIQVPIDDGNLNVHHIKPVSQGGGDEPTNLITLCIDCHKKRHQQISSCT